MYQKKLSIIIPTKNRQMYAEKCIRSILNFNSNDLEIVVKDNSDDDSLRNLISDVIDNKRVKYDYEAKCLSFCENFEKAIELSSGDYLCMIGDDDSVFYEIIELSKIMREKQIKAAIFSTETSYIWPNAVSEKGGKLVVRKGSKRIKSLYTKKAIRRMTKEGNYDYQRYSFPKIYHGIIKRDVFDLVKEKTGHYFGGLSPDIYSALALSYYVEKILYVDAQFTLPGVCAKSGSADSLTGRHTGDLRDAPHFRGHSSYNWEEDIPFVYSVDTIWAETAFKSIREMGHNIKLSKKEYFSFLTYLIKNCPTLKNKVLEFYADRFKAKIETTRRIFEISVICLKAKLFLKRCFRVAFQLLKGRYVYNSVDNIEEAQKIAQNKNGSYLRIFKKIKKRKW